MKRITYEQAYKDREYLWHISSADDMTGGYVDQDDLEKLLAKPTKATARQCLINQIDHWFSVGMEDYPDASYSEFCEQYPEIEIIRERHFSDVGYGCRWTA